MELWVSALGDDPSASLRGLGKQGRQLSLSPWMQVKLGLLQIDELARLGGKQCDEDGDDLRNAEPYVSDIDHVLFAVLLPGQPAHGGCGRSGQTRTAVSW